MSAAAESTVVRPSPIHGMGVFAGRAFTAEERVLEYLGERISKDESLARCEKGNEFIFYLDETWNLDGSVPWNPARLLNHSCDPNCHADRIDGRIWIVAQREIAVGEELTFNYSYDLSDYHEHPCHCGSLKCAGYMVAEELFNAIRSRSDRSGACGK